MPPRAADLIQRLRLAPHPEGGHYAEVFRSALQVETPRGARAALTSIYFLLAAGEASRWHRVAADEIWCHLEGAPIDLHLLAGPRPELQSVRLGAVAAGTQPQCTVPAGAWQAACSQGEYSLAACMVGPGFDFADFELMRRDDPLRERLAREHPSLARF